MVHLGPPGACRLVVPLPLPGRIPDETGGSEGPSGSVPTSGTSGTWKLVPGLGITRYVYRHHGTVAETDVGLHRIPARPLRHRPFCEHEPATPAVADAALGG